MCAPFSFNMAQVKKFQQGGSVNSNLFDIGGRNVNKNDFIYLAKKNWNTFKSNYNISGDDAVDADNAFNKVLQSIERGDISSMGENGELFDKTGTLSNNSDQKNSYGKAAQYLWELGVGMDTYQEDNKKKGLKYEDTRGALGNIINNSFYGGNYTGSDQDIKLWLNQDAVDEKGVRSRVNRMNALANYLEKLKADVNTQDIDYEGSKYKDKNERLSHIDNAISLLKKGEYNDNVLRALMDVGDMTSTQAMSWLADGTEQSTQQNPEEPAQLSDDDKIKQLAKQLMQERPGVSLEDATSLATAKFNRDKQQSQAQIRKEIQDINFNNWFDEVSKDFQATNFSLHDPKYSLNYYKNTDAPNFGIHDTIIDKYEQLMSGKNKSFIDYYKGTNSGVRHRLRALLDIESERAERDGFTKNLRKLGNGLYALRGYTRYNNGYAWVYNSRTGDLNKVQTKSNPYLFEENEKWWTANNAKYKQGGILFAQQGASIREILAEETKNARQARQDKIKTASQAQNRPEEAVKNGSKKANSFGEAYDNMNTANKVRFYSATADLVGAVASFVPGYGNAISLGQGIISDVARAGADISEGYSAGDVAWNFAKGLGMTAIGAIPLVGTGTKLSKAWKATRAFVPWALSIGATMGDVSAAEQAYKNIESGKGTVDDYMAMVKLLTSVSNTTKLGSSTLKARAIKNATKTNNTEITIKGKKGNIKLNQQQLDKLKTAKTQDEMNQMIKSMGHNDEIAFSRNMFGENLKPTDAGRFGKSAKVTKSPVYDFSLVADKSMYRKGPVSEVGMMQMNINRPSWMHLPSFGYKPTTVTKSATPVVAPSVTPTRVAALPNSPLRSNTPSPIPPATRMVGRNNKLTIGGYKKGGRIESLIEKYQAGGKTVKQYGLPTDDIWNAVIYDLDNRYRNNFTNDTDFDYVNRNINVTDKVSPKNNLYDVEGDKPYTDPKQLELYHNQGKLVEDRNKNFYKQLLTNPVLAEKWARDYLKYNKSTTHGKEWFEKNNIIKDGIFNFGNFVNAKYNGNRLWEDHLNATGHDVYKGKVYYIEGQDGYYGDKLPEGYRIDPTDQGIDVENGLIRKYKLIKDPTPQPNPQPTPQPQNKQSVITPPTKEEVQPTTTNPSVVQPKSNFDPTRLGADALALRTALDTIRTNNLLADRALGKQLPLKNPNSMVAPTADVYNILANGQQNAGQINTQGRQAQNSVANTETGLLARLHAARDAAKVKQEAGLKADEKRQAYADKAVEVGNYNHAQEVETGNFNNGQLVNKKNMDIDILNGRDAANLQVRSALSDKYELDLRQKLAKAEAKRDMEEQKAELKKEQIADMQEQWNQRQVQLLTNYYMNVDPAYVKARRGYEEAVKNKDTANASKYKADMDVIANKYKVDAYNQMGRYSANRYGVNWNDLQISKNPYSYSMPTKKAKGGTIYDNIFKARLDDNRRFDKRISESIKTTQKAIGDSSAITKAILNKLMSKW